MMTRKPFCILMMNLDKNAKDVLQKFEQGHFVVQKSLHRFSSIPYDHLHEQLNDDLKGSGEFWG